MSSVSWQLKFSGRAERSLHDLAPDDQQDVEDVIEAVATNRQPASHRKCKQLEAVDEDAFRVRVGDYRVVLVLRPPHLEVHRIDQRDDAYEHVPS